MTRSRRSTAEPWFQGALFFDIGRAWFRDREARPTLGRYGFGVRFAYDLSATARRRGFVSSFFGYNY